MNVPSNPQCGIAQEWESVTAPTTPAPGPWQVALTTSVLGAVTTWALERVSRRATERKRR